MKTNLKELFILFKLERRQLFIFIIFLSILIGIRYSMFYWYVPDGPTIEELKSRVVILTPQTQVRDTIQGDEKPQMRIDINTAEASAWEKLGFSDKQTSVILKYRDKIGFFQSIEDLLNIYIIDSNTYADIQQNIYVNNKSIEDDLITLSPNRINLDNQPIFDPVNFDPNMVTKQELEEMGFKKAQVKNLINYRDKVGVFENPSQLKALYTFSDSLYEVVAPYIHIQSLDKTLVSPELPVYDVNTADTSELTTIQGVGIYYASLIIDYRSRLGGIISLDQLEDIGIREESLQSCLRQLRVDTSFVPVKMEINTTEFKDFLKHPYFDFYHTKKLFDHREKVGKFTSLHDLKQVGFIEPDYVDKITPYLFINGASK